jgi:HK97 family phage major capsid protein
MDLDLENILTGVKQIRDEVGKLAQTSRGSENKLLKMGEQVTTVESALEMCNKRIKEIENAIRLRPDALVPGLTDEATRKGQDKFSITDMLFDKNSESRSMAVEYTKKKRAQLEAAGVRDLSTQDDASGGYLVPHQMLPGFIILLRPDAVVWQQSGLTAYEGLTGVPVEIPKETLAASVFWVGENVAPSTTNVTFGQVRMEPHKLGGLVKLSNRLIRLGTIAEQVTRKNIAKSIALGVDTAILNGLGGAGQPLGIANTPGISTVAIGANGGPFSFQIAENMAFQLQLNNAYRGTLKYIFHPAASHYMKAERIAQFSGETAGAYVILPMSDDNLKDHLGLDFLKTTVIPNTLTKGSGTNLTQAFFGNWEDVLLGLWADIEFKASDTTGDSTGSALSMDQLWIYCFVEVDVQLARGASMCLVNDASGI